MNICEESIMKRSLTTMTIMLLVLATAAIAHSSEWQPVTGDDLRSFISGTTLEWEEDSGRAWGEYRADGTGTLHAWGAELKRTWKIEGDDQLCFHGKPDSECWTLEKSTTDPSLYRATNVATGEVTEIRKTASDAAIQAAAPALASESGPAAASAAEMAKELANPANPIMVVFNNFDYVIFDGDLPGASDQTMIQYFFQTIIPFKLHNGNSVLFRPGIPVVFDQAVPNGSGGYDEVGVDLGNIGYDLIYTGTTEKGLIWGLGAVGTIPTTTNESVGLKLWGLGPEVMGGKAGDWGAAGFVLAHQWDIAGSGSGDLNLTTFNYFYGVTISGSWVFAAAPVVAYNHEAVSGQELTLPIAVGITKTVALGGRPWQFKVEYWYNAVRPDAYAAVHTI